MKPENVCWGFLPAEAAKVYLIDLGVNAILGYRLTRDPIELSHEPVVKCVLHGGAGPRHLVSRQSIAGIWVAFFQECQQ